MSRLQMQIMLILIFRFTETIFKSFVFLITKIDIFMSTTQLNGYCFHKDHLVIDNIPAFRALLLLNSINFGKVGSQISLWLYWKNGVLTQAVYYYCFVEDGPMLRLLHCNLGVMCFLLTEKILWVGEFYACWKFSWVLIVVYFLDILFLTNDSAV